MGAAGTGTAIETADVGASLLVVGNGCACCEQTGWCVGNDAPDQNIAVAIIPHNATLANHLSLVTSAYAAQLGCRDGLLQA